MIQKLIEDVRNLETEERGKTQEIKVEGSDVFQDIPILSNWLWSNRQRECHSLHEISYRACFKPQLPQYFIKHLSKRGHTVYDPFAGRGTTMVETMLAGGRKSIFNDINPVCLAMAKGRVNIPTYEQVEQYLEKVDWRKSVNSEPNDVPEEDLLAFYSQHTLGQIRILMQFLMENPGHMADWVTMVCMHLLTGHSDGYFSVRSMPPNQAIPAARQRLLNEKHGNIPEAKDIFPRILKKTKSLLRDIDRLGSYRSPAVEFHANDAADTPGIESDSVDLIVTSPPFMDVVDYRTDNWLKAWFLGKNIEDLRMKTSGRQKSWKNSMFSVFSELERVLKSGGVIAFEVGDIKGGKVMMEELVVDALGATYLEPRAVLINDQDFTKTARCWNVDNHKQGTNTNRIVLIEKL